jgi:hypothetical protein
MLKRCKQGGGERGRRVETGILGKAGAGRFCLASNTMQTCVSALKYCKVRYYVERGPSFFYGNTRTLGIPPMKTLSHRVLNFFSSRQNWDSQFRRGDIHCGTLSTCTLCTKPSTIYYFLVLDILL